MKTAIGFLGGQFGDCILQEPTIRAFLEQNPHFNLILACNQKYADVLSFYRGYSNRVIGFHAYEGYDDAWPTERDKDFIHHNHIDVVLNAMSAHKDPNWPLLRHQTIECGDMFDIKVTNPQIQLPMPKNIPDNKKYIAISLFPNNGEGVKTFSLEKVNAIISYCKMKGYEVLQLNGPQEPILEGTTQTNTDFYTAGVAMLGCKMLITGDSAMSWLASAFNMPTVGLYSLAYYPFCSSSRNWNPLNKNAIYLEDYLAENISNELIYQQIDKTLSL